MIAAQIWFRWCRIFGPAAALDLTGIEACLNGVFGSHDQGFARRVFES